MKMMVLLLVAATGLMALDATGKWTGTLTPDGGDGGPALLVLKQEGSSVTGTAGPNENEQHAVVNGKVENGKITFELAIRERSAKFVLVQVGEEIKGDVKLEREGQAQTGKLAVTRSK